MPFIAYMLFFFAFISSSMNLINEHKSKTIERLITIGGQKLNIILGYIIGYTIISIIDILFVLLTTYYIFNLSYNIDIIIPIIITLIILSISAVTTSILIANLTKNEYSFMILIPLITLIPLFTSNIIIEAEKLPKYFKIFSYISPIYYANKIIKYLITENIILDNSNIDYNFIFKNISFIILYIIISLVLSYIFFNKKDN
jgi:ABC-2 type transport system permease protein